MCPVHPRACRDSFSFSPEILSTKEMEIEMKELTRWQKARAAVERWKANNREYYLTQKRSLASRPEYLAHRRAVYQKRRQVMRESGLLPKKRVQPTSIEIFLEKKNI